MKKTLVALAALAATGAFAQVSITGSLIMGYEMDHFGTTKTDRSGLGVDTSEINFAATEDLGGGLKATAKMQLASADRGGAAGGDASLALASSVATLTLATTKGADYLSGGVAKVGGTGMDGKVFSQRVVSDSATVAIPLGAVTVSLAHAEPANTLGLGGGAAGASCTYAYGNFDSAGATPSTAECQRTNRISVKYAAGALVVDGGYAAYDQQGTTTTNDKSDVRASVSYDLGSVKLGGGLNVRTKNQGTRTDALVSVAMPLGALTLGADWASRKTDDYADPLSTGTKNGTVTGYGLSVDYALSKRTGLGFYYTNFKQSLAATENSSYTAVLLSHSF